MSRMRDWQTPCCHCDAGLPRAFDAVLECFAHTRPDGLLRATLAGSMERCTRFWRATT